MKSAGQLAYERDTAETPLNFFDREPRASWDALAPYLKQYWEVRAREERLKEQS